MERGNAAFTVRGVSIYSSIDSFRHGGLGDPTRFDKPLQMSRMAGHNLVENSSGKIRSTTKNPNGVEETCAVGFIRQR